MKHLNAGLISQRLFHKPNIIPLCGILMAILLTFMVSTPYDLGYPVVIDYPKSQNFDFQYNRKERLPEIFIKEDGTVIFEGRLVTDMEKLPQLIEEIFEERKCDMEKVLVKADRKAPFGKVSEVLACIKKAYIDDVSLIIESKGPGLLKRKRK